MPERPFTDDADAEPRGLTDEERARLAGRSLGQTAGSWETGAEYADRNVWGHGPRASTATRREFLAGFAETHTPGPY